jgi:hypothetical protein
MNVGLNHAIGEYIGIVESDDFISPEMFEKLYDTAKKNSTDVVKSNYYEYRSDLDIKEKFMENLKGCEYNSTFSPMDEKNIFFVAPSIWSGIYKRSFLENCNIKFNETPGASFQDTSFAFKVWASAERVYLLKDAFLYYRKDNMNSSVKSASKVFCICDEYEEIEKFLEVYQCKKNELAGLTFSMKFRDYKGNYNFLISTFQYAFLLKMVEEFKKDDNRGIINEKYLSTIELNEISNIIHNPDKYFIETAKDYRDDRLMADSTLNLQFYTKGFLDCISKYENIIVYGAGIIGKKVAEELIRNKKSVLCFAVSDTAKNQKSFIDINIYSIYDLLEYAANSIILVAVKERDQYDIVNTLKNLKFKNIVSIDSVLLNGLVSEQ